MKAVHLVSSVSRAGGGVSQAVRDLALAQADAGVGVGVVGLDDGPSGGDLEAWGRMRPRLVATRGPRAFGYAPEMGRALEAEAPDLAHSHGLWMYPSLACLRWARRARRPYLVTPHGMLDPWALAHSGAKKRLAGALFQDRHLAGAACLHSLCAAETKALRAYGLRNPVCEVPNGVGPAPEGDPSRAPWARIWDPGTPVLLFLGRLHPKKGLDPLLRAWARLPKTGRVGSWRLAVAGWDQGGHAAELGALARELGLGERVLLTGPLFGQAKADAFKASAAFVLPSLSEGLPVAVLEAWSHGLPALLSAACNLPEGFRAGAAAETPTDPAGLAAALEGFLGRPPAELAGMGRKALDLVEARFRWGRVARDLAEVYAWILGGGPRPGSLAP